MVPKCVLCVYVPLVPAYMFVHGCLCTCYGVCVRGRREEVGSCVGVTGCGNVHRSDVSWLIGQGIEGGIDRKGWEGKRCREDRVGGKEV